MHRVVYKSARVAFGSHRGATFAISGPLIKLPFWRVVGRSRAQHIMEEDASLIRLAELSDPHTNGAFTQYPEKDNSESKTHGDGVTQFGAEGA